MATENRKLEAAVETAQALIGVVRDTSQDLTELIVKAKDSELVTDLEEMHKRMSDRIDELHTRMGGTP